MPAQIIRTSSKLGESIHLGLEISQMFARTIEFAAQHLKFFTHGIDDCRCCPHPRCVRIASAAQIRQPAILSLKSACQLLQPLVQLDICSCQNSDALQQKFVITALFAEEPSQ